MQFKPAKCPTCNGDLQVPDNMDVVKCMYCGNDVIVREAIKLIVNSNIPQWTELANTALKLKKFGEADHYFSKILEFESVNSDAWKGKAECLTGTNYHDLDTPEVPLKEIMEYYEKAILYSQNVVDLKIKTSNQLFGWCGIVYESLNENFEEGIVEITSLTLTCEKLIGLLEYAYHLNPGEIANYDNTQKFKAQYPLLDGKTYSIREFIIQVCVDMQKKKAFTFQSFFKPKWVQYYKLIEK